MASVKVKSSYPGVTRRGVVGDYCEVPPGVSEVPERQYRAYLAGDPGVKLVGAGHAERVALPVPAAPAPVPFPVPAAVPPAPVPAEPPAAEPPAKKGKKAKE